MRQMEGSEMKSLREGRCSGVETYIHNIRIYVYELVRVLSSLLGGAQLGCSSETF